MKINVTRAVEGGWFYVSFTLQRMSDDEIAAIKKFGEPTVVLRTGTGSSMGAIHVPITKVGPQYRPGFSNEQEAKKYENEVLTEIREGMARTRDKKDDFTSTEEVEI